MKTVKQPKGEIRRCERDGKKLEVIFWMGDEAQGDLVGMVCTKCGDYYEERATPSLPGEPQPACGGCGGQFR